ncbi:expressed unknown protein [Ectocarpus siliculosus]|uniref:Uncharacterized protein n=1 Tax=Ectocarpus siliculosus TaxID=2880 RepID=D7FK68_ECTSI|nr:expressed unknown protein [Ectocarpus siliculosus]|eukprot:CBJ34200.1 expressed unknown protein [Ectocarpus siliculosus]
MKIMLNKPHSGEEQADFISTFGFIQPQNTMSGPVGNAVHKEWSQAEEPPPTTVDGISRRTCTY